MVLGDGDGARDPLQQSGHARGPDHVLPSAHRYSEEAVGQSLETLGEEVSLVRLLHRIPIAGGPNPHLIQRIQVLRGIMKNDLNIVLLQPPVELLQYALLDNTF